MSSLNELKGDDTVALLVLDARGRNKDHRWEKGLELLLVMQMKRQFMLLDENSGCEFNAFCAFYELKGERGRKVFIHES